MFEKNYNQESINVVWQEVWATSEISKNIFKNQLFLEAWQVFEKYIPRDAKLVLEAGGGSGRFGLKIAQDLSRSEVVIIDIVDSSLGFIRKLAQELGLKNVSVSKNDVLSLSFADSYFDVVFSDAVIQHLPNYELAMAEMTRVLKPGGRLIVSNVNFWNFHTCYKFLLKILGKKYPYGHEKSFKKKELRKIFLDNKLKVVAEDGFYPAYGILRLKRYHNIFKLLGRICNRSVKILDRLTNRFFSRNFGFEIVIVGKKSAGLH